MPCGYSAMHVYMRPNLLNPKEWICCNWWRRCQRQYTVYCEAAELIHFRLSLKSGALKLLAICLLLRATGPSKKWKLFCIIFFRTIFVFGFFKFSSLVLFFFLHFFIFFSQAWSTSYNPVAPWWIVGWRVQIWKPGQSLCHAFIYIRPW